MSNQVEVNIVPATPVVVEVVETTTPEIVLDAPSVPSIIEIGVSGPQGPPGDEARTYVHYQNSASATWVMPHSLGFKPSVELLNSGSQEIEGDILHLNENVCIAYFNQPIAGLARLN